MSDAPQLIAWHLTLPAVNPPGCELNIWRNPFEWEGNNGWMPWGNASAMVVIADSEQTARQLASDEDCEIWLDPAYALCIPVDLINQRVVVAARGGAENE